MEILKANKKWFLGVAALVVVILMMVDLNSRLTDVFRLSAQRDQMRTRVYELEVTRQALDTRIAYATSDAAVIEWAREVGHMSQPDDHAVVPLAAKVTPTPYAIPTPTPHPYQNWQVWQALFFAK